ncbi:MAG: hypothetical protein ACT4QF_20135 [Sporichthyaceae bacterium]
MRIALGARGVAAVALGAVLTGCGGGGSEPLPAGFGTAVSGVGFTVGMPGGAKETFEESNVPGGKVTLTDYLYESGEQAYRVSVSGYPKGTSIDLDEAVQSSATSAKGRLVGRTNVAFRSRPGRDAQIEAANGSLKVTAWARYFFENDRLYVLQFLEPGHGKTATPKQFQDFVGTFRFT